MPKNWKDMSVAERRAEWVKDLTSGKFKQCKGSLRIDAAGGDEYCCLGVACETVMRCGGGGKWGDDSPGCYLGSDGQMHCGYLGYSLAAELGLCNGDDDDTALSMGTLQGLNDIDGKPFDSIAEVIRSAQLPPGESWPDTESDDPEEITPTPRAPATDPHEHELARMEGEGGVARQTPVADFGAIVGA